MVNFMWQADLHGLINFVTDCLQPNASVDHQRARHLISPRRLEQMTRFFLPVCITRLAVMHDKCSETVMDGAIG